MSFENDIQNVRDGIKSIKTVEEKKINETYASKQATIKFDITADRSDEELSLEISGLLSQISGIEDIEVVISDLVESKEKKS